MEHNNKLLNIKQLSAYICLSTASINRMLLTNSILKPDYLVGKNRKRLWHINNVEQWLNQSCANPKKIDEK